MKLLQGMAADANIGDANANIGNANIGDANANIGDEASTSAPPPRDVAQPSQSRQTLQLLKPDDDASMKKNDGGAAAAAGADAPPPQPTAPDWRKSLVLHPAGPQ